MNFHFRALLLKLLYRLFRTQLEKVVRELDPQVIADSIRRRIEKSSDKEIDQAIKAIKEKNFPENYISELERGGMRFDVMLQCLENEKYLRQHRRKYHPEGE